MQLMADVDAGYALPYLWSEFLKEMAIQLLVLSNVLSCGTAIWMAKEKTS